ncbi:MAG: helix-turn-helix domain-containing protein [Clostridium sp.]|nr:helix-turn-helix domain-containing protein [Clostridium sp.]
MKNNEIDIEKVRASLSRYMDHKGYTVSSLSKKCDIYSSTLKLFFNEKLTMKNDLREAVIHTVLDVENITLNELLKH